MKHRATSNVRILGVSALVVVGLLLVVLAIDLFVVVPARYRERLVRLLCETDYSVLLADCRELSDRVRRGDLKEGSYGVRLNPSPDAASFPQSILNIQPGHVVIENDGHVILEMLGAPSYGVAAYPEGANRVLEGKVELIPGLWYYDEDYDTCADCRKDIDALVAEGKRRNSEHGHVMVPVGP